MLGNANVKYFRQFVLFGSFYFQQTKNCLIVNGNLSPVGVITSSQVLMNHRVKAFVIQHTLFHQSFMLQNHSVTKQALLGNPSSGCRIHEMILQGEKATYLSSLLPFLKTEGGYPFPGTTNARLGTSDTEHRPWISSFQPSR